MVRVGTSGGAFCRRHWRRRGLAFRTSPYGWHRPEGLSERPAGRRVTSPKVALMDPPGFTRYLVFDRDHRLLLADDLAGPWEPPINLAGIQYVPLVVLSLASRPRMPN
jgi:hypothetical protein